MPEPTRRAVYRTWMADSRRWDGYRPRPGDIIVATYPKCGTTWMQRIVDLLIFQTPEPRNIGDIAPWLDRRIGPPVESLLAKLDAQTHRRFLKSHMPFDALPIFDDVRSPVTFTTERATLMWVTRASRLGRPFLARRISSSWARTKAVAARDSSFVYSG